ncbi:hypothetical protein HAX54_021624, partial [Datura stramonium]|nr:hypothetical protein [Datura stramonium]
MKVHYDIKSSDESPFVTTREQSKAKETTAVTSPLPQSEGGGEGAESDSEDPLEDDTEEGDNDVDESGDDESATEKFDDKENSFEKSGDKESVAQEFGNQKEDSDPSTTLEARSKRLTIQGSQDVYYVGLSLNEKGNPHHSIQEEPWIRTNALNENNAPSRNAINKELVLDSILVRAILVDISKRTITRVLMGGDYTLPTQTTEYDYRMEALKGIRKLSTED